MTTLELGKTINKRVIAYLGTVTYVIVPLYMRHGYYGLINAKAKAFLYCAIPAVIAVFIVMMAELSSSNEQDAFQNTPVKKDKIWRKPKPSFFLLSLIGIWALCSSLLSMNFKLSLMGTAGWSVGSLMTAVLAACTIYVSMQFQYKSYMVYVVMAVNVFINLLAVVQSAGIDLFGLLENIENSQHYAYLSTIGQKNSYSGYLCLLLPLFWGAFMMCRDCKKKILYGAFSALGFMGIIVAESDSTYAGIGICVLFMLPFVFGTEQYIKRSSILLFMYSVCLMIIRFLPVFSRKTERFKGISKSMIMCPVAEIVIVFAIAVYFLGGRIIRGKRGKYILIAIELAAVAMICTYAVNTAVHFNDNWGTNRGMIWRIGWEQYLALPLRKKITGVGPEMLVTVYAGMRAATGKNVVSAHCEPLQILLTQGMIGIILYIIYWGYMLKLYFGKRLWNDSSALFFFPLAAYWGQSLFCSVYPVTAVMFSFASGAYLWHAENK